MADILSLGNNEYDALGAKLLQELYEDEASADVTLVSKELRPLKAHKHVLSISSDFFKKFFNVFKEEKSVVYLKDIAYDQLELLLKFLYIGQCQVAQSDVDDFIAVGQDLKINPLCQNEGSYNNWPSKLEDNKKSISINSRRSPYDNKKIKQHESYQK